jgi:hypothetical protein
MSRALVPTFLGVDGQGKCRELDEPFLTCWERTALLLFTALYRWLWLAPAEAIENRIRLRCVSARRLARLIAPAPESFSAAAIEPTDLPRRTTSG